MRKLVCIFAHPDDEAFGPAGTIAKFAKTREVYVLCATRGEAGKNYLPSTKGSLASVRENELKASAKILGVKNVYFLGFEDGTLCNNIYHKLATKIQEKLEKIKPETILTFEPQGVSGHIDHITISMVTSYVFYKLPFIKKMLQHCVLERLSKMRKGYFIYFPPGYKRSQIDKTVNTSKYWPLKVKAMRSHRSQIEDAERVIAMLEKYPKEEFFLEVKKS